MAAGTSSDSSEQDQVSLDITKLSPQSMSAELNVLKRLSNECCIYRVPLRLRSVNEKAYTPHAVSIGPFHHGREELKEMEEHKKRYLNDFLGWTEVSINHFVKVIEDNETKLRGCYAENIGFSRAEFVKMILVDAAFIIVLLMKFDPSNMQTSANYIYQKPWMINEIRFDLLLIENQLPFFILQDLFTVSKIPARYSLIKLAAFFIKQVPGDLFVEETDSFQVQHLLDLLRICMLPSKLEPKTKLKSLNTPTITELQRAGVKFKLSSSKSLLEMKFKKKKGILEIPRIKVDDHTEILLRNIQAFERCHCNETDKYLCDYIAIIKLLLNTPKDVEILVQKGIVENWLWSNEGVSLLLHNLSKENLVSYDNFYYSNLIEDLNAFCRMPWYRWKARHKCKAVLKLDYCNTPFATVSVIAASILLILTAVQAVCSIIQL